MRDEYIYYVYMMQSTSRRALYIGMTNNLRKRVANAIDREKQLKCWRREKKEWLVEGKNPGWKDLAADWYGAATQDPSTAVIVH